MAPAPPVRPFLADADARVYVVTRNRRAAAAVPSNIAERQARLAPGKFRQFVGIVRDSLAE